MTFRGTTGVGDTYQLTDALRALASIAVALSHVRDLLLVDYPRHSSLPLAAFYAVSGMGHQGVIVFFVLSGFWISRSVMRRSDGAQFWGDYLIDRLSRLWLVLLPALVLGGALDFIGTQYFESAVYAGGNGNHSAPSQGPAFSPTTFIGNALFLQGLAVPVFGSNGPLWSLAYEFWFYLWFPAIWLTLRHRRPALALVTLLPMFLYPKLIGGFACWLCGAALYAGSQWQAHRVARALALGICGAGAAAAAGLALFGSIREPSFGTDLFLALSVAGFLYGAACSQIRLPRWTGVVSHFGAKASFSLYAIHYPIVICLAALIAPTQRWQPSVFSCAMVLAVLAALIVIAKLFSQLTENKTASVREWGRRAHARLVLFR